MSVALQEIQKSDSNGNTQLNHPALNLYKKYCTCPVPQHLYLGAIYTEIWSLFPWLYKMRKYLET